jgi:hypothetical protein
LKTFTFVSSGDVVEGVVHVGETAEGLGRVLGERLDLEGGDERRDVVSAAHRAEQVDGFLLGDDGRLRLALDHVGEEGGLHLGRGIDARRDTVLEQIQQELLLSLGRLLQQLAEILRLLRVEGPRRDPHGLPLLYVLQIGVDHLVSPLARFQG